MAAVLATVFVSLNRGPADHATVAGAFQSLTSLRNLPRNLVAFLCYQALAGPLLVYALLYRGWKFAGIIAALVVLGVALSKVHASANLVLYAVPAALGVSFLVSAAGLLSDFKRPLSDAFSRHFHGGALTLFVWLASGMVALPYVHMSAKYLLPGVPAAALLIVLHAARVRQQRYPFTVALLIALGWISGALIVWGDTTLASSQREAVDGLIVPRIRRGLKVWAGGQWAFLAYAGGCRGATATGQYAALAGPRRHHRHQPAGLLRNDGSPSYPPRAAQYANRPRAAAHFVLNRHFGAGFYSIRFGYLPFAIGCGEVNAYDLYRVLP